MQHQEDYDSQCSASEDDQYFASYGDFRVHRVMLNDGPRMNFYYHLLSDRSSMSGKCVVDVGAGTGVLGMWAVQNGGAAHCLSFEGSPLAATLSDLIESNKLSTKMTVIPRRVEDVVRDGVDHFLATYPVVAQCGGVDVVVSEWMGFYLLHECMLPSVLAARDFFARVNEKIASRESAQQQQQEVKSVRMVPNRADIWIAPVSLEPLFEIEHAKYWHHIRAPGQPESSKGLDFSLLARKEFEEKIAAASPLIEVLPPSCLLRPGQVLTALDLQSVTVDEISDVTHTVAFTYGPSAAVHPAGLQGFVLWFTVSQSPEGLTLDTSPMAPPTHWKSSVLLLPEELREGGGIPLSQLEGEEMNVQVSIQRNTETARGYTLTYELS